MKKLIIPASVLTVMQNTALVATGTATGPSALALAAVIAQHSPALRAFEKPVTARLFRGDTRFGFTSNTKIPVDADSATGMCRNPVMYLRPCAHDRTQQRSEGNMNRGSVLSISAMTMLGLAAIPNSAISQQWSLKDQLVGTWTLASWEHVLPNGSKVQSYGTNPKGIVVFDAKGRFFLMFARPDLPKIASNAPATATSEEAKNLLAGSIAYFGTYGVNDADRAISLRLEASTFPNQLASDQNGTITSLTADELQYEMTALAGGKIIIALKREAVGCGRARDWNAIVPRRFSPHEL